MALTDDLTKLAAQDVVYLTRTFSPGELGLNGATPGSTEVFRGRLRQALDGKWVFNASTGQNGVVGFMLGSAIQNSWNSSESPASGLQVTITFNVFVVFVPGQQPQAMTEVIVLTTLIPTDFAD
jgi:hypothetical protein